MGDVEATARWNDGDLLVSSYGVRPLGGWRGYRAGRATDLLFDARLAFNPDFRGLDGSARQMPVNRVHVAAVEVPERRDDLRHVFDQLGSARHIVTTSVAPIGARGKFSNINLALRDVDLSTLDWLIVTDDDVALPPRFLDRFLCVCAATSLRVAQPAHRFHSHATWQMTQRVWNSLAHVTNFVECGPLTAFHRDAFAHLLPFPETRWAWGIDVLWGEIARRERFRVGVVDATPIAHLRPVAQLYDADAAIDEARDLLSQFSVQRNNREILKTVEVISRL